jgi:OmpA-OmpF porin, OOP family
MTLVQRGLSLAGLMLFLAACAQEPAKPAAAPAPAAPAAPAQAQAAPAPAPAPTPAPPAAAQPPRDFIVYFDLNSTKIRTDAAATLDSVVTAYRALGGQNRTITVVGHTDRSGSNRFNQRLSVRRADAVEAYLAKKGISATLVMTSGLGELDPRVATPDGVKEQQNRRAELRIN